MLNAVKKQLDIGICYRFILSVVCFAMSLRNRKLSASRRDTLGPRYDKKYLVFGEKMEEGRYEATLIRVFELKLTPSYTFQELLSFKC